MKRVASLILTLILLVPSLFNLGYLVHVLGSDHNSHHGHCHHDDRDHDDHFCTNVEICFFEDVQLQLNASTHNSEFSEIPKLVTVELHYVLFEEALSSNAPSLMASLPISTPEEAEHSAYLELATPPPRCVA